MENLQKKRITILDLNQETVNYTDKETKQPKSFVKYIVKGNDGIPYETSDREWFIEQKIGSSIDVSFFVKTIATRKGVLSRYVLVVDKPRGTAINQKPANDSLTQILKAIKDAENNIISAIKLHAPAINVDEQPTFAHQLAEANEEKAGDSIPVINEGEDELGDSINF